MPDLPLAVSWRIHALPTHLREEAWDHVRNYALHCTVP